MEPRIQLLVMLCGSYLPFLRPVEFSVLVDVSSERCCHTSAVGEDDICSLYQFTISSANTQPADKGECTYLILHFLLSLYRLINAPQKVHGSRNAALTKRMTCLFYLHSDKTLPFSPFFVRDKSENMFRHVLSHTSKKALGLPGSRWNANLFLAHSLSYRQFSVKLYFQLS